MKPAPFTYHDPETVEEAVALLAQHENARPLAGGQSLVPMMNFRYAAPDHIVDLNGITQLATHAIGARIVLGAMVRQRTLEFSAEVARTCPVLLEALRLVGHRQTRNRGTLGGSLCHLDPAAEMPAIMMLHDAEMTAQSKSGMRTLSMRDFGLGFMTTALAPDELLTGIAFDAWPEGHGFAFEEYARRHGDFAMASCGVLLTLDARGHVHRFSCVVGGLASVPLRLSSFEDAAAGARPDDDFARALSQAASRVEASDDAHATAAYRRHLAGVLAGRALRKAVTRARERIPQNA